MNSESLYYTDVSSLLLLRLSHVQIYFLLFLWCLFNSFKICLAYGVSFLHHFRYALLITAIYLRPLLVHGDRRPHEHKAYSSRVAHKTV